MSTPRISFSGHETFPLRFNWLKKGVDSASDDPEIFNADRAIAQFGVGKNMVRAIRHWGLACGTLEDHPDAGGGYRPTEFGLRVFGKKGMGPVSRRCRNGMAPALEVVCKASAFASMALCLCSVDRKRNWCSVC